MRWSCGIYREQGHRCGRPYYLSGIANLEMYRLSQNSQNLVLAEHDFNEVINRNPYSLGTYLILGKTKSLQGNYSEAKEYYIKAMKDSRHVISAITEIRNIENKATGIRFDKVSVKSGLKDPNKSSFT